MSTWVVVPDMQVPDHDRRLVDKFTAWVADQGFDGMAIVGDELDSPEPSRWNRGYAGEYAGTLQKSINECHRVLAGFREAMGDKPIHLMRSNHQERIQKYVAKYAPALSSLESLDYQRLLGLDDIGVTFHRQPYEFTKGWHLAHGDEGGSTQTAGGTALSLARKWGTSVCAGHTHKAGIQHQHISVNGKITRYQFGMEVGHFMDMRKAGYLKAGSANWSQAFAIIEDGRPSLRYIVNGQW